MAHSFSGLFEGKAPPPEKPEEDHLWACMDVRGELRPPMRFEAASALVDGKLYVHGGQGAGTTQAKSLLWALDLKTRTWLELDGPRRALCSARAQHSLCAARAGVSPNNDGRLSLVVFGGQGEGSTRVDMRQERPDFGLPPHQGPVMRLCTQRAALQDAFIYDVQGDTWRAVEVHSGAWPTPRRGHTATHVLASTAIDRIIARQQAEHHPHRTDSVKDDDSFDDGSFLSSSSSSKNNQGSSSSLARWKKRSQPTGSLLLSSSSSSSSSGVMVVLGGAGPAFNGFEAIHAQLWALDLASEVWVDLSMACSGSAVPGRFEHTATLLGDVDLVVVGGLSGDPHHVDAPREVSILNVDRLAWSLIQLGGEPVSLYGHAACALDDAMVLVFGGRHGGAVLRSLQLDRDEESNEMPASGTWHVHRIPNEHVKAPVTTTTTTRLHATRSDLLRTAAILEEEEDEPTVRQAPTPRVGCVFALYDPPPPPKTSVPKAEVVAKAKKKEQPLPQEIRSSRRLKKRPPPVAESMDEEDVQKEAAVVARTNEEPVLLVYGGSEVMRLRDGYFAPPDVYTLHLDAVAGPAEVEEDDDDDDDDDGRRTTQSVASRGADQQRKRRVSSRRVPRRASARTPHRSMQQRAEDAFTSSITDHLKGGQTADSLTRDFSYEAIKRLLVDANSKRESVIGGGALTTRNDASTLMRHPGRPPRTLAALRFSSSSLRTDDLDTRSVATTTRSLHSLSQPSLSESLKFRTASTANERVPLRLPPDLHEELHSLKTVTKKKAVAKSMLFTPHHHHHHRKRVLPGQPKGGLTRRLPSLVDSDL